jgi:hypothetical protein
MGLGIPDDSIATCCHNIEAALTPSDQPLAEARLFWDLKILLSCQSVPGVGVEAP